MLGLVCGCGSGDSSESGSVRTDNYDEGAGYPGVVTGVGGYSSAAEGDGATVDTPEVEDEVVFDLPQAGVNYVYAANAERDTIAVIDATTLGIHTVETGDEPRSLRTLAGRDAALAVDLGSNDVAYVRTADGSSTFQSLDIVAGLNAIHVSPDGKYAIVTFDAAQVFDEPPENYQDITVLDFTGAEPVAARLTVGFRPRAISFGKTPEGEPAAYLVTDDGVSVVRFTELEDNTVFAPTIAVFEGVEQKSADVAVTADGRYAVGRVGESSSLRLVALGSQESTTLDVNEWLPHDEVVGEGGASGQGGATSDAGGATSDAGGATSDAGGATSDAGGATSDAGGATSDAGGATNDVGGALGSGGALGAGGNTTTLASSITDVDLSSDGTAAFAVLRDRGLFAKIPIPAGFSDGANLEFTEISGIVIGQSALSPNGHWAVLYTTAVPTQTQIAVIDLRSEREPRIVDVKKSVTKLAFSSDGERAFIVHEKSAGDPAQVGISDDEFIRRSYGYSVLDLETGFGKLQFAESDIATSVLVPESPYLFLSFTGGSRVIHRVNMESLLVDSLELGSLPIALGVVPAAERVFVSQEHADGRITFIDWNSLDTSSVTGFELNSKIRE